MKSQDKRTKGEGWDGTFFIVYFEYFFFLVGWLVEDQTFSAAISLYNVSFLTAISRCT